MSIDIDLNNLPDNPEETLKIFEQLENGDELPTDDKKPEDDKKDEGKTEDKDDAPAVKDGEDADDEPEADGVATKDGKHIIPYSVLRTERDRAARAEQLLREAQERLASLEKRRVEGSQEAKHGESASTDEPSATEQAPSEDDLEMLKEEFPSVYKSLRASLAKVKKLEERLQPIAEQAHNDEINRQRSEADRVQDAIDSIPKLAHIQSTNPEAFQLAVQFDAGLKVQKAWADKPLSERFQKVMEMVEASLGEIALPGNKKASAKPEDLEKAAKAKAASQSKANRSDVPLSLSEFPAGTPAVTDEQETIGQLTHLQLADKFARMTPDQLDAYLQSL